MADLLAASPSAKAAVDARLKEDFGTMKSKNGTAVRLYLSLHSLLLGPNEPNLTAAARLVEVVNIAAAAGLTVDVTGANVMRPWAQPAWLAAANYSTLRAAHHTFWQATATALVGNAAVLGFNLVNEPTFPAKDDSDLVTGCLPGDVVHLPECEGEHDGLLCYCNSLWRNPSTPWTADIQKRFDTPAALKKHWHDFPRAGESWSHVALPEGGDDPRHADFESFSRQWKRGWCSEMAGLIHGIDKQRRVTLGDLQLSTGGSMQEPPEATCTTADGLDYYSLHLYPQAAVQNNASLGDWLRNRVAAVPDDGAKIVVEEMFPLGAPPSFGSPAEILRTYLSAMGPRTVGWMSFYCETMSFSRCTWLSH